MTLFSRPQSPSGLTCQMAGGLALAVQAVAVTDAIRGSDWQGMVSTLLLMGALALLMVLARRLPAIFSALPVVALAVPATANAVGLIFDLYQSVPFYDDVLHFSTGFAATLPVALAGLRLGLPGFRSSARVAVGSAVLAALAIGLAWEGMEASFGGLPLGDTLGDLLFDALGGALAGRLAIATVLRPTAVVARPGPAE